MKKIDLKKNNAFFNSSAMILKKFFHLTEGRVHGSRLFRSRRGFST